MAEEKELGRRERKKIASRLAIVRAAKQEFIRKGYKEASIADIMERAGLGVGTFYNYFASKEEVLMHILAGLVGEVVRGLTAKKQAGTPAVERLVSGCREMARLLDENSFVLALFLSVGSGAGPHGHSEGGGQRPSAPAVKDVFLSIIEEAQAEGSLRCDVSAQLIAEMVHACFQSAAFSHLPLTFRENFEQKFSLLLDGVRVTAA